MGGRFVTAVVSASVLAASCAGCSSSDNKVAQKTAHITVDNSSRTSHAVVCSQIQSMLTADITAAPARIHVWLKLDSEKPKLESVNIENFAGFTGVSDAGAGNGTVVFAHNTYTIRGEAVGSQRDDPRISVTTPFKIDVGC